MIQVGGGWLCFLNEADRVVVQLAEIRRRAAPVMSIGLVPHLPIPLLHLRLAVALDAVLRPLVGELAPLVVVLGRIFGSAEI